MSKHRYYHDRLTVALDDLLRCRRYCQIMLKLPMGEAFSEERTIFEALYVAFIVSYGRVFTTSNTVHETFKSEVSNDFGNFRNTVIKRQEKSVQNLHARINDKRDTAMAHSDAKSRNYQHYGNSPLAVGRNPYCPFDHQSVSRVLDLTNILISEIGDEQIKVGKVAFEKPLFGN